MPVFNFEYHDLCSMLGEEVPRRMMRHSSLDTTMRCYLNANTKKIKTAANAVDRMLFQ